MDHKMDIQLEIKPKNRWFNFKVFSCEPPCFTYIELNDVGATYNILVQFFVLFLAVLSQNGCRDLTIEVLECTFSL